MTLIGVDDYLDAARHGTDENGALFRPVRNNTTGQLDNAITQVAQSRSRRLGNFCTSNARANTGTWDMCKLL